MVERKRCPSCGEVKARSEYGRNQTLGDGLSFYCLACNRANSNASYRRRRAALGKEVRDLAWVPAGFRWCPSCRQAVAHEDYVRSARKPSGFGSRCKSCHNAANKAGYRYRMYKLTEQEVAALRAGQLDRCAICGDPDPQHLDHDHQTGEVRQLLCQRRNHGLGLFRDDPDLLRAAAEYVERHRVCPAVAGSRAEPDQLPGAPPRRRHGPAHGRPSPGYARWLAMHSAGSNG